MTAPPTLETQAPLPPLDAAGFWRWAWRQLTSMRIALILLFALAVASIPGSILPQRGNNPLLVDEWLDEQPTIGPILDRLGFFDVFGAPWFAAVYLLLFISLIGCVLPRVGVHWRAMRSEPPIAPRNLSRLSAFHQVTSGLGPTQIIDNAATFLRKNRWRVRTGVTDSQVWVSAEKGYLRETGNLVFHLALVLILAAVAVGGLFGWRGNVIVKEGSGFANTLTQYDAWGGGRLASADTIPPFAFTLDDFAVEFERSEAQRGSPRLFEASVQVQGEPGGPIASDLIEVNYPLRIAGAKIFLVGHGYAPTFIVRDASGATVLDDAVVFLPQDGNFTSTGVMKVPDSDPQLGFQGIFLPTSAIDDIRGPHSIFPDADDPSVFLSAWEGDLGLDSGVPQSVYTLKTDAMEQIGLRALVPGQVWDFGRGQIEFTGWQRWASFQIAFDPGKEAALAAAVIATLGLTVSLFTRRRRVWVKAERSPDGSTLVQSAGLSKSEAGDVSEECHAVMESCDGKTRE
ncbi:MAG: cytochrome c biogenesis protein ResB [Candidatus Nanopelagicales bacterium]